jgi:hypothetical protein
VLVTKKMGRLVDPYNYGFFLWVFSSCAMISGCYYINDKLTTYVVQDTPCKLVAALNTTERGTQFCSSVVLAMATLSASCCIVFFWLPVAIILVLAAITWIQEVRERCRS